MKKLLSIFLCLILAFSIASCNTKEQPPKDGETELTSQEAATDEKRPYSFLSKQDRMSWKEQIITVLSANDFYEQIEQGCLGAALMDLNLDNTPELIIAYAGDSMGTVCIVAYDLESGEELCTLSDIPHYQELNNIYLCVHRHDDGSYILVNEGGLLDGLATYVITSKLTEDFRLDALFLEITATDADSRYFCGQNKVDKLEFETKMEQFQNAYKAAPETQIKIIYWDRIKAKTRNGAISEMADALVNSEQQFINFDH